MLMLSNALNKPYAIFVKIGKDNRFSENKWVVVETIWMERVMFIKGIELYI